MVALLAEGGGGGVDDDDDEGGGAKAVTTTAETAARLNVTFLHCYSYHFITVHRDGATATESSLVLSMKNDYLMVINTMHACLATSKTSFISEWYNPV